MWQLKVNRDDKPTSATEDSLLQYILNGVNGTSYLWHAVYIYREFRKLALL